MSEVDRSSLPIRRETFDGVINRTLDGSQPDWNLIGHPTPPEGAPNVLLVLIDDAGFGNPSTFGGPIQTPNYTRVAEGGLRYNRFHVTALCSPTRAALLTGRNNHAVGFGSIGEFAGGFPGYSAIVPRSCAPLPRILRDNGYSTARVREVAPDARRRSKVRPAPSIDGRTAGASTTSTGSSAAARVSGIRVLAENQKIIGTPDEYYDDGTSVLLPGCDGRPHHRRGCTACARRMPTSRSSCTSRRAAATHHTTWRRTWADKYKGKFDQGWDVLREETFARQKELGVIPADAELTPRDAGVPGVGRRAREA